MTSKLIRLIAILCTAAVLLLTACSTVGSTGTTTVSSATGEKEYILIGRVVPVSGTLASFGSGTPYVEQSAIDYINETYGGIYIEEQGRILPLKLVYADSESSMTKASEAAVKLIQEDGIDIMIVSNTADTVRPVSAACERYGVPCISVDAPVDVWLDGGPYTYSFHAFFNTENELSCFMDAWDLSGAAKKIGLLAAGDFEGLEIASALPAIAATGGYSVVDPGRYNVGQTNYHAIIGQLKENNCEIIAGVMNAADFAIFWQQCADLGYRPKVCSIAKANLFAEDVAALGNLGNGLVTEVWWSTRFPGTSSLTGQSAIQLGEDYLASTDSAVIPATVGYKHANVELLYDILSRARSLKPDKVIDAIKATDLDTIVGNIRFGPDNTCIMPCVTGQWIMDAKGEFRLAIVANSQAPDVPISDDLILIP